MKKIICLLFILVMMSSTCFASMSIEYLQSMSIGGIQIGSSEEYVRGIYGEPDRIEYDKNLNGTNPQGSTVYTYVYGGTFKILFCGNNHAPMYAGEVISVADNGIKTEAGLSVGDTESTITELYGTENIIIEHGKNGVIKYSYAFPRRASQHFTAYVRHGVVVRIELVSNWNV